MKLMIAALKIEVVDNTKITNGNIRKLVGASNAI
jgi:hypothetical protein